MASVDDIKRVLMAKAMNEQMDRFIQENGNYPSKTFYSGGSHPNYIPTGYDEEVNQKVMLPAMMDTFKTPEEYIIKSEDYLQNFFKKQEDAPLVIDPPENVKNIQDLLYPTRKS
jgi:hypothetical protein